MASLIRCDSCRKLSDEQGVGYVGKNWSVKETPRTVLMQITSYRDLCRECVKKLFAGNSLAYRGED